MISYLDGNQNFVDLFLSQVEAKALMKDLQRCIDLNEDEIGNPVSRKILLEKTVYIEKRPVNNCAPKRI